jgi:hypothetical protein
MRKAPIAFFAYKRPQHTLQSLESLAQNEGAAESELFIFCDAPKRQEDQESVKQVREVVRSKQWCGTVNIIERETNLGLANSIIRGVTDLCDEYGSVIVIEDDLVLSPFFLNYMNKALNLYKNEPSVMQISGYMFPVKLELETDAIFLPFSTSWGWATWQRAWKCFDLSMSGYEQLKEESLLRYKFDLDASYPYFKMLESQRINQIDSWAIVWYLSVFMRQGMTLFPTQSLVRNIGFDGSGTHGGREIVTNKRNHDFDNAITDKVILYPSSCEVCSQAYLALAEYFKEVQKESKSFINILLKKLSISK